MQFTMHNSQFTIVVKVIKCAIKLNTKYANFWDELFFL